MAFILPLIAQQSNESSPTAKNPSPLPTLWHTLHHFNICNCLTTAARLSCAAPLATIGLENACRPPSANGLTRRYSAVRRSNLRPPIPSARARSGPRASGHAGAASGHARTAQAPPGRQRLRLDRACHARRAKVTPGRRRLAQGVGTSCHGRNTASTITHECRILGMVMAVS